MTDSEKLAMVYAYIEKRIRDVTKMIADLEGTDINQHADYLLALGERRALMELSHKLMGVTHN